MMISTAFTSRCSSLVLPDGHRPPPAPQQWQAQAQLPCYQQLSTVLHRTQPCRQRSRRSALRAISSSLGSATAPAGSLDQALFPAGGALLGGSTGGNGDPVKDDGKVMVTFRWPAALGGQNVSVVGAAIPTRCSMCRLPEGASGVPSRSGRVVGVNPNPEACADTPQDPSMAGTSSCS